MTVVRAAYTAYMVAMRFCLGDVTGTMGPELSPMNFEPQAGSLYSVDKDRTVKKKSSKYTISNGLAWSADRRTMYFIDTVPRQIHAFNFDVTTGAISKSIAVFLHLSCGK